MIAVTPQALPSSKVTLLPDMGSETPLESLKTSGGDGAKLAKKRSPGNGRNQSKPDQGRNLQAARHEIIITRADDFIKARKFMPELRTD